MQIRRFKPGQLICRMSKRSRVNFHFRNLIDFKKNRLKQRIDKDKKDQRAKELIQESEKHHHKNDGCGAEAHAEMGIGTTVVSGYVNKLVIPGEEVPDDMEKPEDHMVSHK